LQKVIKLVDAALYQAKSEEKQGHDASAVSFHLGEEALLLCVRSGRLALPVRYFPLKVRGARCGLFGGLKVYDLLLEQFHEMLVERLHAVLVPA
jgi:hypothetical protein